jgi:DNA-binding response OmpR family regulator
MHILIVEDESPLAQTLSRHFTEEGYKASSANNGKEALQFVESQKFDVILLDWKMPKMNGIDFLKYLRDSGNDTPVILLTALSRVANKIEALELGADDYITKPFSFDELHARVKAVTRRSQTMNQALNFGEITLDLSARKVRTKNQTEIKLTEKEFDLLKYLITNKGTILSKEQLCLAVWELNFVPPTNICEATIKNLRKKLEDSIGKKIIKTVYGEGYTLVAD